MPDYEELKLSFFFQCFFHYWLHIKVLFQPHLSKLEPLKFDYLK